MDAGKTGRLISQLRKEKGYTQKGLAERLNVSDKAISRWETGKGFPDTALLKPLSDELGVSVGELLAGERFCREEAKEKTDQVLVSALKLTGRERAVLWSICGVLAVICILLLVMPWVTKPGTLEFVNDSQTSKYYDLGEVSRVIYGDFQKQELRNGYVYYRREGTELYGFTDTPEGPLMRYMHRSGTGRLFGFEIGDDTVIKANAALGLEEKSLRAFLEESGFRYRYDLQDNGNAFGRPTLVYINGERCNWYPYTKDNVFINICISAHEGNRLLAFDIGLLDGETEAFSEELLSGFPITLEDPQQLVTGSLQDTYRQWDKITVKARDPGEGESLYLYLNGQLYGKFNGPDPFRPEEYTVTFEMWGAPVTILVTPDSPDA